MDYKESKNYIKTLKYAKRIDLDGAKPIANVSYFTVHLMDALQSNVCNAAVARALDKFTPSEKIANSKFFDVEIMNAFVNEYRNYRGSQSQKPKNTTAKRIAALEKKVAAMEEVLDYLTSSQPDKNKGFGIFPPTKKSLGLR